MIRWTSIIKVLKLELDRTVRPRKPRTAHFCSFLASRTPLWEKSNDLVRTAIEPHGSENRDQIASQGSLLPFESETLKKKNAINSAPFRVGVMVERVDCWNKWSL